MVVTESVNISNINPEPASYELVYISAEEYYLDDITDSPNSNTDDELTKEKKLAGVLESSVIILDALGGSAQPINPQHDSFNQPISDNVEHAVIKENHLLENQAISFSTLLGYGALLLLGILLLCTGIGGLVHLGIITTALIFIAGNSLVSGLSIGSLITGSILLLGTGLKLALDFCRSSVKQHIEPAPAPQPLPPFLAEQSREQNEVGVAQAILYQPVVQPFVSPSTNTQVAFMSSLPELVVAS